MITTAAFSAMGTDCRVDCDDGSLVAGAVEAVLACERKWSRFITTSEINRLNGARGAVVVSADTAELLAFAAAMRERTGGAFDPRVGPALHRLGYASAGAPGLDVGGVAKGFAADSVAARLIGQGARYAAVDLGGDVRVIDTDREGCEIEIADPFDPDQSIGLLRIVDGGVATSSTWRRRWTVEADTVHHLIDPATGRSADAGVVQATVVAASAALAEALTKVFVVRGIDAGRHLVDELGAAAVCVGADRRVTTVGRHDALAAEIVRSPL